GCCPRTAAPSLPRSRRGCSAAWGDDGRVRLNARVDYAVRAVVELAASGATAARPVTSQHLATTQDIPTKFLESILLQLRRGGIINSQRGPEGGYWLGRPAGALPLAHNHRPT